MSGCPDGMSVLAIVTLMAVVSTTSVRKRTGGVLPSMAGTLGIMG